MSMADYNKMVYMCRMANLMGVECKNVVFHLFMFCVEGLLYLLGYINHQATTEWWYYQIYTTHE